MHCKTFVLILLSLGFRDSFIDVWLWILVRICVDTIALATYSMLTISSLWTYHYEVPVRSLLDNEPFLLAWGVINFYIVSSKLELANEEYIYFEI